MEHLNIDKFLAAVSKLSPIDFIGLATYLGVNCYEDEEKKTPKTGEVLLYEATLKYAELPRRERRALLKHIKEAAI
jgi:hypothetical protein